MTIFKVIYIFDRIIRMLTVFIQDLGFLALAIIQAGAYILESQCGLERYLNMYQNCLGELLEQYKDQVQKIDDYKWTVYTTWNISFEQLSPHASTFLKICAFLHNDYITEEIFQNAAVNIATFTSDLPIIIQELDSFNMAKRFLESFQIAQNKWDIKFLTVIKEICSYSLINFDSVNNVYSIHPLVHAWTLTKVSDIAMTQTCTQFILGISINWRFNDVEDYIFRQKFLPHLDTALANIRDAVSDAVKILGLSFSLVYSENGQWTKAEKLCMQVMEIRKKLLGEKHPATLTGMANLASTYRNQGRWKEAEELEVQVMDITKRVLGAEHPDTLTSMGNLALTYRNQGRWKEAEELEVQVMDIRKRVLGAEHPDTLTSIVNLASTFWNQGRWKEAEELEVQVMDIRKRVLGAEHPSTLTSMGNLASTYSNQGRWKEAEELEVQVMDITKRVLGAEHPDTLTSMANLASTFWNQGRWKEAEELEVQVMETSLRVLGQEHPDTLTSMANLASTFWNQGRWKEAEELDVQVMETSLRVLGAEHPSTLTSMNNLAHTYKLVGRSGQAIELMKHVVELLTKTIGANHPTHTKCNRFVECVDPHWK